MKIVRISIIFIDDGDNLATLRTTLIRIAEEIANVRTINILRHYNDRVLSLECGRAFNY